MKFNAAVPLLLLLPVLRIFSGGNPELVNTQEISLENITEVKILYSSEHVSLFMGTSDTLVIKEYMNDDNSDYYARINRSGNSVSVENGKFPVRLVNVFKRRLEVYLPLSYGHSVYVKTSSGKIGSSVDLTCPNISIATTSGSIDLGSVSAASALFKTTSGRIKVDRVKADVSADSTSGRIAIKRVIGNLSAKSTSGSIRNESIQGNVSLHTSSGVIGFDSVTGDLDADSSSGGINLGLVAGSVKARTSSGNISCKAGENAGDMMIATTSGRIKLSLPRSYSFSFTAKTSSGRLTTPFQDKLFIPVNDRSITQGNIGSGANIHNVDVRTSSGSINISWI